jgi:tetratricopeptide (TPR) repeat protein
VNKKIFFFIIAALLGGCAGTRGPGAAGLKEPRVPNPKAVDLFIDGVVEDADQNFAAALLNYQEAVLYDSKSPALYKAIGKDYLWLGREESAFLVLKRALTLDPKDTEAMALIGRIIAAQGNPGLAEKEFRAVLALDSNSVDTYYQLALLYLRMNRIQDAIGMYRQILSRSNEFEPRMYSGLADLYMNLKQYKEAEAVYRRLLAVDPAEPLAYLGIGTVHEAGGDTAAAELQYRRALELEPAMEEARDRLGGLLGGRKQWDGVIDLYRDGLANDSSSVSTWLSLGDAFREKGDTTQALATYGEIEARFPENWQGFLNHGRMLLDQQKPREAFEQFQKVVRLSPGNFWGLLMGGVSLVHQDSLTAAAGWLEKALEINPQDPLGNYYFGTALSQMNRPEDAVPRLQIAVEARPVWVSAISALAGAFESLKQYPLADTLYIRALAIEPDNALVLNNYGYSLSERGVRLDEAAAMARKAIDKDPENGAYLDTMGWILFRMGDYEKALPFIQKAFLLRPNSPEVADHLGDVYDKLEKREDAVRQWEKASALDPGNAGILLKLGRPVPETR